MTAPVLQQASTGSEIAMTAPVVQEQGEDGWTMAFVLPNELTIDDAPSPSSEDVTLREIPGERVAAVRYSGRRSDASMERQLERLRVWIEEQGLATRSTTRRSRSPSCAGTRC